MFQSINGSRVFLNEVQCFWTKAKFLEDAHPALEDIVIGSEEADLARARRIREQHSAPLYQLQSRLEMHSVASRRRDPLSSC